MKLELDEGLNLSGAEQLLVARARHALAGIEFNINENSPGVASPMDQIVTALIYDKPLRIDFKAHVRREIGQAFIGPQVLLTEGLFAGDGFTPAFITSLGSAVEAYRAYLREPPES